MPRRDMLLLRAIHARLLEAFRSDPEPGTPASFRRAGEAASCDWRTARRGWQISWEGLKPIRELIDTEKTLARAALHPDALRHRLDEASRLAQEDAILARAEQGKTIRLANNLATYLLFKVHEELKALTKSDDPQAKAQRQTYKEVASLTRELVETAATGQRMEALVLGEATAILGGEVSIKPVTPVSATPDELAAEVEAAQRALDEVRRLEEKKDGGTDGVAGSAAALAQ